jgi:ABC-2 type transport system permease protein
MGLGKEAQGKNMEKKEKKDKNSFSSRRFKNGAYSTLLIAAGLVIFLLANLIVNRLGITLDLSSQNLYTLSQETETVASGLKDDITIYYVVTAGQETPLVENVVDQYQGLDHIQVVKKDPLLYPTFTAQYTDEKVSDNSVIVVNERTGVSKYIAYADLLVLELAYEEGSGYYQNATGIDAEGQITSAILYVTAEDLPTMYAVSGHGEAELNETILNEIGKLNVKTDTLDTLSTDGIPEDCDLLLINGPQYDFSKEEVGRIQTYLENGGRAVIYSGYTEEETPNFTELLAYYGIQMERGVVAEGYGHYVGNYITYTMPAATEHEIVKNIKKPLVVAIAQGMTVLDQVRSSLTVEPLLNTSADSYLKKDVNSQTTGQEAEDPSGPFVLGAAITDTYQGKETKLVVYSSSYILDETMLSTNQFGNGDTLLNAVSWMTDLNATVSIPSKNIEQNYITMNSSQAGGWALGLIILLPAALIIMGFVVWFRRRKG